MDVAENANLSDPHWGIAVSLHCVAVLDILVRGLCTVSKSETRFVARRMSEESYLQRETKILAQGAFMFTSVGRAMRAQGWQVPELAGVMALVLGQAPGLIPDARRGIEMSRPSQPTALVPLASLPPADPAPRLL